MKRAVHDAQPSQKEPEGQHDRKRIQTAISQEQRSEQPRQRQQQFPNRVPPRHNGEIAPWDLPQAVIPRIGLGIVHGIPERGERTAML